MSVILYGISNCDTCRKARRWLDAEGINHQWHDLRKDGLDADKISQWLKALDTQTLINRRGQSWRKLSDAEKAKAEDGDVDLLLSQPTLIKRPVLEHNGSVSVGFKEADWQAALKN